MRRRDRAHRVHAAVEPPQPTRLEAAVDGARLEPELHQRGPRNHTVLAPGELVCRQLAVWAGGNNVTWMTPELANA